MHVNSSDTGIVICQVKSHAWVFLNFYSSSKLYLYYKFSSTDLATKAGQRKILCIVMRARKASPSDEDSTIQRQSLAFLCRDNHEAPGSAVWSTV